MNNIDRQTCKTYVYPLVVVVG